MVGDYRNKLADAILNTTLEEGTNEISKYSKYKLNSMKHLLHLVDLHMQ